MVAPKSLATAIRALRLRIGRLRAVKGFADVPYWAADVPGANALTAWRGLSDNVDATGFWPVIAGNYGGPDFGGSRATITTLVEGAKAAQEMSEQALQFTRMRRTPQEFLDAARDEPFKKWATRQRNPRYLMRESLRKAAFFDSIEGGEHMAKFHREMAEEWRARSRRPPATDDSTFPPKDNRNPPQHDLHCVRYFSAADLRSIVSDSVAILFVPTRLSWEVPAHLFYSTLDFERQPQVHVAALKWLFERFGAQLIGADSRVLEVIPRSRPRKAGDALRVAVHINTYSHCPVTSENEMITVPELAVYLMESEYWTFCWP